MMGIINRITKRTLQGEMGRTLLTIFSMGIAATLVIATLVGFTSSQNSLYQKQLKDTGGMQFVIRNVPRENAAKLRRNTASHWLNYWNYRIDYWLNRDLWQYYHHNHRCFS